LENYEDEVLFDDRNRAAGSDCVSYASRDDMKKAADDTAARRKSRCETGMPPRRPP